MIQRKLRSSSSLVVIWKISKIIISFAFCCYVVIQWNLLHHWDDDDDDDIYEQQKKSLLQKQEMGPRSFITRPISALESERLANEQQRYRPIQTTLTPAPSNNNSTVNNTITSSSSSSSQKQLRIALCHPSIHVPVGSSGGVEENILDPYFAFVSYYRLLGVHHIFLWYMPDVASVQRFNEFQDLPYVTLTQMNLTGHEDKQDEEKYYGQQKAEEICLSDIQYAASYDWVLVVDSDEYFWNSDHQSLIDFLQPYHEQGYSYLSFGKYMYTMIHRYTPKHILGQEEGALLSNNNTTRPTTYRARNEPSFDLSSSSVTSSTTTTADNNKVVGTFGLEDYPFTAGSYCYNKYGKILCPGWRGRCKVIVKPSIHKHVLTHGINDYHTKPDGMHFNTTIAHFKEWSLLHNTLERSRQEDITNHTTTQSILVGTNAEVKTHFTMRSHKHVAQHQQVEFFFDYDLHPWMQHVSRGCPTLNHHQLQKNASVLLFNATTTTTTT